MYKQHNKMICTGSWILSYCRKSEMHYFNTQTGCVKRLIQIIEFHKCFITTQIICLYFVTCKDDNKLQKTSATLTCCITHTFHFPSLAGVSVSCYQAVPLYYSIKLLCICTLSHKATCVLRFSFAFLFIVEACTSNCWYLIGWTADSHFVL